MSGHNRWTKIKRKKEAQGAAKGKLFTKLIKELTVAARQGGGDPNGNARLRSAITLAREANMPQDNITRAIKRGTGELEGVNYEESMYEGFAPGGVAILVECLTDNKIRTAGDVRHAFTKSGGRLGENGSVSYQFERRGVIQVKPGPTEDQVMEAALDAGALDVINLGEDGFEVRTEAADVHKIAEILEKKGWKIGEAKSAYLPKNTVKLDEETASKVFKQIESLEDLDDVQNVYANYEVDDAILQRLAG
jgi:YebC/PmpR family DNA-binding regulatory protein